MESSDGLVFSAWTNSSDSYYFDFSRGRLQSTFIARIVWPTGDVCDCNVMIGPDADSGTYDINLCSNAGASPGCSGMHEFGLFTVTGGSAEFCSGGCRTFSK